MHGNDRHQAATANDEMPSATRLERAALTLEPPLELLARHDPHRLYNRCDALETYLLSGRFEKIRTVTRMRKDRLQRGDDPPELKPPPGIALDLGFRSIVQLPPGSISGRPSLSSQTSALLGPAKKPHISRRSGVT